MPLYVFDTDLIGFVQNQHPTVMQNVRARQGDHPGVTTIITFGEDLSGYPLVVVLLMECLAPVPMLDCWKGLSFITE